MQGGQIKSRTQYPSPLAQDGNRVAASGRQKDSLNRNRIPAKCGSKWHRGERLHHRWCTFQKNFFLTWKATVLGVPNVLLSASLTTCDRTVSRCFFASTKQK